MPNTLIVEACAGFSGSPCSAFHATLKFMSRRNSSRAWIRASVELHPGLIDRPLAVGEARLLRPADDLVVGSLDQPRAAERDALVVQLEVISFQPPFSLPTRFPTGTRTSS